MSELTRETPGLGRKQAREQCYLLMMKLNPDPPAGAPQRETLGPAHHQFLIDLERQGVLFSAGPLTDGGGKSHGGLIILRAPDQAAAEAVAALEPFTKAGLRLTEVIPWQRNEGTIGLNIRFSDGVLEIDNRRYGLTVLD
jgi:uncharacterized protein YciI